MTPVYSSEQVRAIDRHAATTLRVPSLVLMENAARGACDVLLELGVELEGADIVIACGRGNNGGDGLALARHALIAGADVHCVVLDARESLSVDASAQLDMLEALAPQSIDWWSESDREPIRADVIIDALLGTGAKGEPRGEYASAIAWLNASEGIKLALDLPTGLDADTGVASKRSFVADATVTMAAMKPGLLLNDGALLAGAIYTVHIGVAPASYPEADMWLLDDESVREILPNVQPGRNKYDRGMVLVIAGARGMTGAGVMSAEAAARTGAGLTVLALPEAATPTPQEIRPEIMTRTLRSGEDGAFAANALDAIVDELDRFGVIAAGPGFSKSADASLVVTALLARASSPVILDADGLAAFAGEPERLADRRCPLVITPHHGEMARLVGRTSEQIGADPVAAARDAARRTDAVVVLKGAPTVVALPDGRAWINTAGNPGMASGGTGDVLTGMIASFAAQCRDVAAGALAGVYMHSLAGDIAADITTERALLATDIIDAIPAAYKSLFEEAG